MSAKFDIASFAAAVMSFFAVIIEKCFLADRTATQYDRLLPAACCPSVCLSVCLSVMLCIVALTVGVRG